MTRGQNRKKGDRAKLDQYFTTPELAKAMVGLLPIHPQDTAIELQAGRGAIVRALKQRCSWVGAIDIDPASPGLKDADHHWVADATTFEWPEDAWACPDWSVTNTPFDDVPRHLKTGFRYCRNVVTLAPLSLMASAGRIGFWAEHASRLRGLWVLAERASFEQGALSPAAIPQRSLFEQEQEQVVMDDGSGFNTDLAVFWWDQHWHGPPEHFVPCWSWKSG